MGLRAQDTIPDWITHVAFVKGGKVVVGDKEQVLRAELESSQQYSISDVSPSAHEPAKVGEIVADLQNIKVQYQDRKVSVFRSARLPGLPTVS